MTPPALSWVRFLRNYGPIPTNGNLFDEHVSSALHHAKVQPIALPTPYVDAMVAYVRTSQPGSLLIAGTAGDGKTYHSRQLWSRLGGDTKVWATNDTIKTLRLDDGRSLVFVKDLSELSEADGDEILAGLERSVLSGSDTSMFVIASNHGQILDRLRKRKDSEGNPSPLYNAIQEAFLQSDFEYPRLKVFDLSRAAHRQSMGEVLRAVTEHPEWTKCESCELNQGDRLCPIQQNRGRALAEHDGGRFGRRLGDLIEIARRNGAHLPVRDLLALVANMLLGHPDAKEGLMTCLDVEQVQDDRTVERASIYRNVFASNLPFRRAMARPVFRTLASFGIGDETTNGIDGLLVYGSDDTQLRDDFQSFVATDSIYGATTDFLALQRQYLEGDEHARGESGPDPFLDRLADQRQRLFFTLPDEIFDKYPFWGLTTFRFAGDYINLLNALMPSVVRRPVDERTRSRLVQGLNRVMTGLLLDNPDSIFIASSAGFSQSKISVLCERAVPARRDSGAGMLMRWDTSTDCPSLDISIGGGTEGSVPFELTPVRFEFLCRVSEGALPSSFSNECFEDLLAFKARLMRQSEVERLHRLRPSQTEQEDESVEADTGLALTFIEVEQNGHGYLKRISVRDPQ